MNDTNSTSNVLDFAEGERPKLSSGLNVLTILTFVGCAIAFISSIWNFMNAEKGYKDLLAAQDKIAEAPAWAKGMMGPEMLEITRKSMENKLPILLLGLVATALCLYGAIEMRKLKKQGFILWLVGEILPFVSGVLFVGIGMFSGFALIFMLFPVIFIILYAVQRKNLVY
jgi:cytochrome c oxidase assembly factor CtaG